MNRNNYRDAALSLYLSLPGHPRRLSPHDRVVADDLFHRGLSISQLAHVMRLVRLRRAANPGLPPIRSLAYYRAVLDRLSADDFDPGYVAYVQRLYCECWPAERDQSQPDPDRQISSGLRSR